MSCKVLKTDNENKVIICGGGKISEESKAKILKFANDLKETKTW